MGADYLAYAIMDMVVDKYFSLLEGFGDYLEIPEETLLENPTQATLAEIRDIIDIYDTSPGSSAIQLNQMLSIISQKKQALEQQIRDIAVIRLELETTEERCLKALKELPDNHLGNTSK